MFERISIDVAGIRVEGEIVFRSRSDIDVRIVSPYRGITAGLHMAYFFMGDPANDYRGPRGDQTAAELLEELYELGKFIAENKQDLRRHLDETDAAIERLDQEQFFPEHKFCDIRRDLRGQLRGGIIDNKVYQRLLVQAKKKTEARRWEIWRLVGEFFDTCFPMIVPVGTRDDVQAVLRSADG